MSVPFALMFPGQGAQSPGMLAQLANNFSVIKETFDQAAAVLGYDLWHVIQHDVARLNQTEVTQPAILTASIALYRMWRQVDTSAPSVLVGHSLGEFTALVVAEALSFEQAVALVAKRGALMQAAVPNGAGKMAAILGLDNAVLQSLCEMAAQDQVVSCANYNAVGQTVVAGDAAAVERLMQLAKESGAKRAVPLMVSVPSHCQLMRSAAEQFSVALAAVDWNAPTIPVIHNADASVHSSLDQLRAVLTLQLTEPVHFVESIQKLVADFGVQRIYECGPGKVLSGLVKRIDRSVDLVALEEWFNQQIGAVYNDK